MRIENIKTYSFNELNNKAKHRVIYWLDECPLDYEDEEGKVQYQYFIDLEELDIEEHCEANNYRFDETGRPIHHLISK